MSEASKILQEKIDFIRRIQNDNNKPYRITDEYNFRLFYLLLGMGLISLVLFGLVIIFLIWFAVKVF